MSPHIAIFKPSILFLTNSLLHKLILFSILFLLIISPIKNKLEDNSPNELNPKFIFLIELFLNKESFIKPKSEIKLWDKFKLVKTLFVPIISEINFTKDKLHPIKFPLKFNFNKTLLNLIPFLIH